MTPNRMRTCAALLAACLLSALVAGCSGDGGEAVSATTPQTADVPSPATADEGTLTLSSPAFADGATIPVRYCRQDVDGGRNESVPLEWSGAPSSTMSFAITMIDTHEIADDWVHWIVVGLPASASSLPAGASGTAMPVGATELESTFGTAGYGGPAPPAGSGDHEYAITVYALDTIDLGLSGRPGAAEIDAALEGHVLASTSIVGVFGR